MFYTLRFKKYKTTGIGGQTGCALQSLAGMGQSHRVDEGAIGIYGVDDEDRGKIQ